jgi:hypothetical protein
MDVKDEQENKVLSGGHQGNITRFSFRRREGLGQYLSNYW